MQPYRPALRAAVAAIALALAGSAVADEAKVIAELGELQIGNTAPAYSLRIAYPDGRIFEREVFAGEAISIDPMSPGGNLVDGLYTYEARPILGIAQRGDRDQQGLAKLDPKSAAAESGTFRVQGNQILAATKQTEASDDSDYGVRMKDQVIADDLIVNGGSLCVGMDCVNGENFGADTIRLKENNLRIHFDDTSNSGSFPNVDWRLVANDQNNGGANYFAIEDSSAGRRIVEIRNAAPANSLFIDSGGRVGLKTSIPAVELHIADGDSPTLRLEQNGSSGFAAQTWDVAGNETNFFVRDVTNGSRLPFKIKPGAPTDSLFVAANGNVGVGDSSPDSKLSVAGNLAVTGNLAVERDGTGFDMIGATHTYMQWFPLGSAQPRGAWMGFGVPSNPLFFFTNEQENGSIVLLPGSNGSVGIGTTSPAAALDVSGQSIRIRTPRTPASSSDSCSTGEMVWDSNFLYVCVAANSWKRTALSSW